MIHRIEIGKTYYGYDCHACGGFIPLLEQQNENDPAPRFVGAGIISSDCPHCGKGSSATTAQIRPHRVQKMG